MGLRGRCDRRRSSFWDGGAIALDMALKVCSQCLTHIPSISQDSWRG